MDWDEILKASGTVAKGAAKLTGKAAIGGLKIAGNIIGEVGKNVADDIKSGKFKDNLDKALTQVELDRMNRTINEIRNEPDYYEDDEY